MGLEKMVYKKYIKRGEKTFGPYYYESYREGDKVKTRFVSGPKKKDKVFKDFRGKVINKKSFLILGFVLGIFLLFLIGNINYEVGLTGMVVDEGIVENEGKSVSKGDFKIAKEIADEELVSNVDIREKVDLEIKDSFFESNKIMEFKVPEGTIKMSFDLLNYSEWVKTESDEEIDAEGFDIDVQESSEKYKWGYNVRLKDLNFMAKIKVRSDLNIVIVDNQTLKIGRSYLSFADLVEEGYVLSVNEPVVLEEVDVISNLSEVDVSEEVNDSEMGVDDNETEITVTEANFTDINITIPSSDTEVNDSELNITISFSSESDDNETGSLDSEEESDSENNQENENVEQLVGEDSLIASNVIKSMLGFFARVFEGLTGFVTADTGGVKGDYVEIYIERQFGNPSSDSNESENYKIGDLINLDPFLIIIEISKAEHLDENRSLIADIYDYVKEQDDNWSDVINPNEYVRVRFEENLTNEKDITVYARSDSLADIGVYLEDGEEEIARFEDVQDEDWYKIYLSNLSDGESYDVFDLRVFGYGVEFDYVVDPSANDTSNSVYRCGTIDSPGVYSMNQSITNNSLTTPCINITAENITLDCAGFNITSDDNKAGIYSDQINTTIKNCNVSMGNIGTGIKLKEGANGSYIFNNTINIQKYGIYLESVSEVLIENNVVNNNSAIGIWLLAVHNTNITNNTINLNEDGISIGASGAGYWRNNSVFNNTLSSNTEVGIYIGELVENTLIQNNFINSSGVYGIQIEGNPIVIISQTLNTTIRDVNISNSGTDDIHITDVLNNSFINCSYNLSKESVDSDSELIRKWYYQVYVNDSSGNFLDNAYVVFYDKDNLLRYNITTNSSGWTNITEIADYVNDGTRTYYNNYTIYAYNSTYVGNISYNASLEQNVFDSTITVSEGTFVAPFNPLITSCKSLVHSDKIYTLQNNISTTGTCFSISANNITIDFNGSNITGDDGAGDYGVYSDGYNQTIIKNGYIHDFYNGVYFESNQDNNITNMTINSSSNYGISLGGANTPSSNNAVENCTILNSDADGIIINRGQNNTIKGNTINSNNYGINFVRCSNNDIMENILNSNNHGINFDDEALNNNITNITANFNSVGIYIDYYSDNNILTNIFINGSTTDGIVIHYYSDNNNLTDINISNSATNDVLVQSDSTNNIFINVSYDTSKESVDSTSDLTRKWYYRAHVTDNASSDVDNATVDIYNGTSGDPYISLVTNASGWTNITNVVDYVNDGGARTYYQHSVIAANFNDTLFDDHTYNVTSEENNLNDSFIVEADVTAPVLSGVEWSATTSSVTITWTTDDPSNSSVDYWASPGTVVWNATWAVNHAVTITGLSQSTTYNYYYTSCDFAGNCNQSANYSLTTAASGTSSGSSGGGVYCIANWKCGLCVNGQRTCSDDNNCGADDYTEECSSLGSGGESVETGLESTDIGGSAGCVSNFKCEDWGECKVIYDLKDIIEEKVLLKGEQKRFCEDRNKCVFDKIEKRECDTKVPVVAKKINRCFKDYLEIYDERDVLISRLELINETYKALNVQMLLDEFGYCPYCYDDERNFDEDEVDCVYDGDSCPICSEEYALFDKDSKIYFVYVLIGVVVLLIVLVGQGLLERRRRKKILRSLRKEGGYRSYFIDREAGKKERRRREEKRRVINKIKFKKNFKNYTKVLKNLKIDEK